MTLERGHILKERYRIVQLLGEGGLGGVYRAWDLQLQGPCAIKEKQVVSPEADEQFRREAMMLLNLNHPNLPRVFDYFAIPERGQYLVMDFVEGEDLDTRLENAINSGAIGLGEAQVLPWMLQVSEALVYLHSQNPPILHRDIKPANIIITPQGQAVLVDIGGGYGQGRMLQAGSGTRAVTPGFSSPEQYGSGQLDVRSDVYSLGATMYNLLTGVVPPDSIDLMTGGAVLIPAEQINPGISQPVRQVIAQAMEPRRANRLPGATQFRNALASAYTRLGAADTGTMGATVAIAGMTQASPPPPAETPEVGEDMGGKPPASNRTMLIAVGVLAALIFCLAGILAWYFLSNRQTSPEEGADATLVFQTVQVEMTQNALATLFASATAGAQLPTAETQIPPTETVLPPTFTAPGATPTIPVCGKATFIADVTIPDNTVMTPGTAFTKTWRVRNDSNCTWDSNYALTFAGGTLLSNTNTVPFPGSVPPGQNVDLSINMVAPASSGQFRSDWLMRTNTNQTFGVGQNNTNPLFVSILVTQPIQPNPTFAYDFTARYCEAQWRTNSGVISCNNLSSDERGSALALAEAPLERGTENEPGLWVRPDQNQNGFIVGEYPAYLVKPGDHFLSEIGCLQNSAGCNVTFQLDMQVQGGALVNLGVWNEVYDEKTRVIDLDLSSYAGQTVRFQLRMVNNDRPATANGIWFVPSIRNFPVVETPYP